MLVVRLINWIRLRNSERGYALLEYCAGAAVIIAIVWVALQAMGTNMSELLTAIGEWAQDRAQDVRDTPSSVQP